jgi:uncharacterized membrane protein
MAVTAPQTGLQISPIRQELHVDPGGSTTGDLVVANLTKQDLDVTLFFREFSVSNDTYDYAFALSHYDWIRLSQNDLTLSPGQSRTISYTLSPGQTASPGGYYFTIFASANLQSGGVDSTIQAASLLYGTVNGKLDRNTRLDSVHMPTFLFSPDITYDFTMTDTGNVYYTIYASASLTNPFDKSESETAAHIVIPGKPRRITGTLPAPKYPGIYTATVGYHTDQGVYHTVSQPVVYVPLWATVVGIGVILILIVIIKRIIRRRRLHLR